VESDPITAAIESSIADSAPEPVLADSDPIPGDDASDAAPETAEPELDPDAEPPSDEEAAPAAEAAPVVADAKPKKRGVIPLDRHQAVLTKARREAEAKATELQQRIDALSRYESPEYQAQSQFLQILESDPARAVAILQQVDPARFGKLSWAEQQAVAQAVAEQAAPEAPAGLPDPDALLPDGTLGYSAEGAQRLIDAKMAQERAKVEKELKALRAELSPIKEEREARQAYSQALSRQSVKLTEARTNWPEFTTHEAEIKTALEQHPTWGLEEAYRAVVVPKLVPNREAIRTEERRKLIEEMNAKSKARTMAPGQQPAASAHVAEHESSDDRMTAIIKNSLATLK
jgi:hypothetical protein